MLMQHPPSARRSLVLLLVGQALAMSLAAVAGTSRMEAEPILPPLALDLAFTLALLTAVLLGWAGWRRLAPRNSRS